MKCQVTSQTTRKVMISREVKVLSYKEICGGEKTRVHIGYNNEPGIMTVKDNKLLQIPAKRSLKVGVQNYLLGFLMEFSIKVYNLTAHPLWIPEIS